MHYSHTSRLYTDSVYPMCWSWRRLFPTCCPWSVIDPPFFKIFWFCIISLRTWSELLSLVFLTTRWFRSITKNEVYLVDTNSNASENPEHQRRNQKRISKLLTTLAVSRTGSRSSSTSQVLVSESVTESHLKSAATIRPVTLSPHSHHWKTQYRFPSRHPTQH